MRAYILAFALTFIAQPAWAHHKQNHPDFPRTPISLPIAWDPCGVSHNPHQPPGAEAQGERCRRLLAQYRATPDDSALGQRCDRAARARTGRTCSELVGRRPR